MNDIIKNYNLYKSINGNNTSSVAAAYNGNSLIENYIIARLTNSKTIRILLDQQEFEAQKKAIADEVSAEVIKTVISAFR